MVIIDLNKCKQDLLVIGSYTIRQIDCPYNLVDTWEISMQKIYTKFKQKIRQRHRIMTMVYAYYLGELIDLAVTPREKWLEFVETQQINREYHYYLGITRVYELFKSNVEQIYRTSYLSYRILLNMKVSKYRELVSYGRTINEMTIEGL
jgi:hypothetical protein